MWDATTGAELFTLTGHTGVVASARFSADGSRIVTTDTNQAVKVWDARTGQELAGEPVPNTTPEAQSSPDGRLLSPDGRLFARVYGRGVELGLLIPDEDELAYRRLHTRPEPERYREGYHAAMADGDEFAARFYLGLLPPQEHKALRAQAAAQSAERAVAAGRTEEAVAPLAADSVLRPEDTELSLRVAALQAWFGQGKELAATRQRILTFAKGTGDAVTAERAARACSIVPSTDKEELEAALALARTAVKSGTGGGWNLLTLGMAEYRSGDFAAAEKTLLAAEEVGKNNAFVSPAASLYRAMSLFRQGKADESRKVAAQAKIRTVPPRDAKNPFDSFGGPPMPASWWSGNLTLWLAVREAKALIGFDATPAASPPEKR